MDLKLAQADFAGPWLGASSADISRTEVLRICVTGPRRFSVAAPIHSASISTAAVVKGRLQQITNRNSWFMQKHLCQALNRMGGPEDERRAVTLYISSLMKTKDSKNSTPEPQLSKNHASRELPRRGRVGNT